MSIINQLEKTVTPAVLGDSNSKDSVAYVSLLEQFYALLAARLALPQVYSHLIRTDQPIATDRAVESPLFEQLWQDEAIQKMIVQELAGTHHIDEFTTLQLLNNAAPLAYRELKILANGQYLPAFLQAEQPALRQYLPIWSAPVITALQNHHNEFDSRANPDPSLTNAAGVTAVPMREDSLEVRHETPVETSVLAASMVENADEDIAASELSDQTGAIHANPSAHHWSDNSSMKREKIRTRNQRNDLLVRVFLLVLALAAIALAAWALLTRPSNEPAVVPVVAEPIAPAPVTPPAEVLLPVEFIVAVDNSGSLYNCSATVGDEALQGALQQALNTSFGEQASICQLTIRAGVATDIAAMPTQLLPNVFTMLRTVPFARLHLQNDRLTVEAPDNMLLQRLVTDIRNLAPTMMIDSTAPIPLPNNNSSDAMNNMEGMNDANNQFENGGGVANNQYNNNYNGSGSIEYQASDDNTGDSVLPAPNNGSFNTNANTLPSNIPNNAPVSNVPNNNVPTNNVPSNNVSNRPSGPISQSEVDEMASSVIVVEPQRVR